MADIWGNLGVDIDKGEGEWLYRVGADVRGPMPHRQLVDKLLRGDIDLNTPVAREGTDFHPLYQVSAFAPHIEAAKRARAKRRARKRLKLALWISLPILLLLGGGAAYLRLVVYPQQLKQEAARERARAAAAAKAVPPPENLPKMGLVALVSLGTSDDVKIHGDDKAAAAKAKDRAAKHAKHHREEGPEEPAGSEPEEEVQSCKLTQQQIFGTLKGALAMLNVCVEDEKKRDTQGLLPPVLKLEFVVKTNGKVTDFAMDDRHYRTGPLNNCMLKAFNAISFPTSTGANCPVTIPIKIGK